MSDDDVTPVEEAIGNLYIAFHRLREAGEYQEAYDAMGALIKMLMEDRTEIRKNHEVVDI